MYPYLKRLGDAVFSGLSLIILSPVLLILWLMVKLTSAGPAVFSQERVGKNCKIFIIHKFRTMSIETKKEGKYLSDFERMTPVGVLLRKFSLDELPQLWNILKGDMSFIGPRPLLVEYIPRYSQFQIRRHEVLPGITGWAQINGRNTLDWEQRFKYDVWYVDHRSLKLDISIFIKTIGYVFSKRDINQSEIETMTPFLGNAKQNDHEQGGEE